MTPQRFKRIKEILSRRQPDLTVVMDSVQKTHNLAAVIRTCDAVGIQTVHAISTQKNLHVKKNVASGGNKWVEIKTHRTIAMAYARLRREGKLVLAAHPGEGATLFDDIDYTQPTAIVVGAELEGLSRTAIEQADGLIAVPMIGMGHSLNVSVATAIILFEARRQREKAGCYRRRRLDATTYQRLLFEWAHPQVASYYRRHHLPYPKLDENGEIVARAANSRKRE